MFLKKDGSIKKSYIEACYFLIGAKMQHHQITIGGNYTLLSDMRDGNVIDEYDAYTAVCMLPYAKDRRQLQGKVTDICRFYDIEPRYKYGIKEWHIEFKDQRSKYENMRQDLQYLLSR